MLFKDYHIPMIRSGSKTVTRREWSENYARPNEGSVQIASDEMFTSDEEADCYIRILDVYEQPLGEMTDEDAQKEGDYEDLEEFRDGYADVYGDDAWDPEKEVWVVEFEYVGRERPDAADGDQQELATDGGQSPDQSADDRKTIDGDELEAEARALEDIFNAAAPDHAPELKWSAMTTMEDGGQAYIFEAENYADRDGLSAIRRAGRAVTYIEAFECEGEANVVLEVPVQGEVPDLDTVQGGDDSCR